MPSAKTATANTNTPLEINILDITFLINKNINKKITTENQLRAALARFYLPTYLALCSRNIF